MKHLGMHHLRDENIHVATMDSNYVLHAKERLTPFRMNLSLDHPLLTLRSTCRYMKNLKCFEICAIDYQIVKPCSVSTVKLTRFRILPGLNRITIQF